TTLQPGAVEIASHKAWLLHCSSTSQDDCLPGADLVWDRSGANMTRGGSKLASVFQEVIARQRHRHGVAPDVGASTATAKSLNIPLVVGVNVKLQVPFAFVP